MGRQASLKLGSFAILKQLVLVCSRVQVTDEMLDLLIDRHPYVTALFCESFRNESVQFPCNV